mmetsp:Transcript_32268/g.28583  ORF Transcript_32268/g.28583 Transcript_32268/m.28583 type:complete len:158 (-) Transcript_32268:30-503(-)
MFVIPIDKARARVFTKEFMEKNFKEEHESAFPGEPLPKNGYPDTVAGKYASKLEYKDWFELNSAHRVHFNFFESITQLIVCILIGGLVYPWPVVIIAGIHILCRLVYLYLYLQKGPDSRAKIAPVILLSTMALHIIALLAPIMIAVEKANDGKKADL